LCQAGQLKEAIFLLEQAAAMRPTDAAYQHNLAQAYEAAGQTDNAIKAFARAVAAAPASAEPVIALAQARIARGQPGDAAAAVAVLRTALAAGTDTAELHHYLGVALVSAGLPKEAVVACRTALTKKPEDPTMLYHLALAHRAAGDTKEVRKSLIKALELQPGLAHAWCGLATLDAEAGRFVEAAALYRRAISAKRDFPAAYQGLGRVLQEAGKRDEAMTAFAQAVQAARGDLGRPAVAAPASVAQLERAVTPTVRQAQFHYALAALTNVFPPSQVPPEAISGLFDKYASYFDDHLRGTLVYRVPELLTAAVAAAWSGNPMDVLDLGCGTGLCGPMLRPMAKTLEGVDLSSQMIEKAKERGVYDRLTVIELVEGMRQGRNACDLLVAADVLIYLGDLSLVFEAAAAALRPGGMFVFSVEAEEGERYHLIKQSRRYTHSKKYLRHLATIYGFEEVKFDTIVVRLEHDKPVSGSLLVLRRP